MANPKRIGPFVVALRPSGLTLIIHQPSCACVALKSILPEQADDPGHDLPREGDECHMAGSASCMIGYSRAIKAFRKAGRVGRRSIA